MRTMEADAALALGCKVRTRSRNEERKGRSFVAKEIGEYYNNTAMEITVRVSSDIEWFFVFH
jgi:hypothetical protein